MSYHQITAHERYTLATLRRQVPELSCAAIARIMGRHRSTISREIRRNSARFDGAYRHTKAQERTNGRRARSRRNTHFTKDWRLSGPVQRPTAMTTTDRCESTTLER